MGLFDSLFGKDPSADWPERAPQSLRLSLADLSLNNMAIGDSSDRLSTFGRPSNNRPFKEERFTYQNLGIEIEIEHDSISYFAFPLARQENDFTGPCMLTLVFPDGHSLSVDGNTGVKVLLENLPVPAETHKDDDETIYLVTIKGNTLELETSNAGLLRRINVIRGTEI